MTSMTLVALVFTQRLGRHSALLPPLERAVHAMTPIEQAHRAGCRHGRSARLAPEQCALSDEAHLICDPDAPIGTATHLLAAMESAVAPVADAAHHATRYGPSPGGGKEQAIKGQATSVAKVLKEGREKSVSEIKAIRACPPAQWTAEAAKWDKATADIELELGLSEPLPRNTEGMPALFWPPATCTRDILLVIAEG